MFDSFHHQIRISFDLPTEAQLLSTLLCVKLNSDRLVCCSRILNKCLDNYVEDMLPWHESIEPCLSSLLAFINDREVRIADQ